MKEKYDAVKDLERLIQSLAHPGYKVTGGSDAVFDEGDTVSLADGVKLVFHRGKWLIRKEKKHEKDSGR